MAETVLIRAILQDEASRKIRNVRDEVDDLGDAADDSSKDVDGLNKSLGDTEKQSKKTSKEVRGLTGFFDKMNTNVRGFGYLLKAAKIPVYLGAFKVAVPAVGALAAGIGALVGALGPLTGAVGAVPALATSLISVVAVSKLATAGIGDAVKAMTKQGATAEEVAAAMENLSPAARQFAKNIAAMKPEFDEWRKSIADRLLPGLDAGFRNVIGLMPMMGNRLGEIASTMGNVAHMGGAMLASGPFQKDLSTIMQRNNALIGAAGGALLRVIDALRHVAIAARPLTDAVTRWIESFGLWAQRSAEAGRETGKLEAFFGRTVRTLTTWGHIIRDLSIGLFQIFKIGGGGLGNEMVGNLEKGAAAFRDWSQSERGIARITGWFDRARPILKEMYYLVRDVMRAIGRIGASGESSVVPFLQTLRMDLLPALETMITNIDTEKLGVALGQLATAVTRFMDYASFQPLIDGLTLAGVGLNFLLDLFDHPAAHQFATTLIGASLAMKTLGVAAKVTGLKRLHKELTDGTSATRRFVAGLRGAEEGQKGLASALGRGITKMATFTKKVVLATAKLVIQGTVMVAQKAKALAVAAATGVWTAAQWLLNAALTANPLVLLGIALAALVVGLVIAYQKSETFRNIVQGAFDAVSGAASWLLEFFRNNWPTLLAILTGPIGLAVLAIVRNWDKIKSAASSVWNWVSDKFTSLVNFVKGLPGKIRGGIDRIVELFRGLKDKVIGFIDKMLGPLDEFAGKVGGVVGKAGGLVGKLNPFGDTKRPRAVGSGPLRPRYGALGNTLTKHAAVTRATPGTQRISNVGIGGFRGSDHHRGKAVDVVGSNLQTYVRNVKQAGGYAAIHGSGQTRHAHAAYGDTLRPRARAASSGGGTTLVLEGPLIGEVNADSEVDVTRAVRQALNAWITERQERS